MKQKNLLKLNDAFIFTYWIVICILNKCWYLKINLSYISYFFLELFKG